MKLESFEFVTQSENRARLFFRKACWKNGPVFCTRCRSRKVYRIVGRRYRCKRCKYTFHDFSNRWINELNISFKKWLWIVKFFELEVSARKIAQQVGLSYPTVLKAVTIIRLAIVASQEDVGGWPALAENRRELTIPGNPSGDDDSDGYTNLEEWLHGFAADVEGCTD